MRTVKQDLDLINRAVEAEGKIGTDGVVTVPNDFFDRLNEQLNPPRQGPSLIDRIIAACEQE